MCRIKILLIWLLFFNHSALADSYHTTIQAFLHAFNVKDVDAMLDNTDPGIAWMYIDGDSIHIETTGHNALQKAMEQYFDDFPSSQSELIALNVSGNFATAIEKASWQHQHTPRSQCSVSVYQFAQDKIMNIWYYPATACE